MRWLFLSYKWNSGKNLKVLKYIVIVAPAVFIGVFEAFRHVIFVESQPMVIGNVLAIVIILAGCFLLFNFIFGIIERLQSESLRQNQELTALNRVGLAVNESLNLDVVLYRTLDEVLQITTAEAGEIFLLDDQTQDIIRRIHAGLFSKTMHEKARLVVEEDLVAEVIKTGEPVIVPDLSQEPGVFSNTVAKSGFQSVISVPLKSKTAVIGILTIVSRNRGCFTREDMHLLTNMSNQITMAIENARLYEKVQIMAVLEERERIAREMHDGLAQVLSYVIIKSQAARQFISSGQEPQATKQLKELETDAQEVYADVREVILGLKSMTLPQGDILSALQEYALRFSQTSGIRTEVEFSNVKLPPLPTNTELQVIRIIQEALTNVRKHAKAKHAWVRILGNSSDFIIDIIDDGHGFNTSRIRRGDWPKFGLQTMRERAESIMGTLDIESFRGKGTKVSLRVPLNQGLRT